MQIYKVTNLINNKIYIGKNTRNDPHYYGSGILIKKAINKYGKNNFKKEILEDCNTINELNIREIYWIKKLNANSDDNYNIASGGEGGFYGCESPRKGKHISDEHKNKISDGVKRILNRPDVKEKLSIIRKGRKRPPFSKEWLDNMKKSARGRGKGNENNMYGRCAYDIWLEKYGKKEADRRRKIQIEKRKHTFELKRKHICSTKTQ